MSINSYVEQELEDSLIIIIMIMANGTGLRCILISRNERLQVARLLKKTFVDGDHKKWYKNMREDKKISSLIGLL